MIETGWCSLSLVAMTFKNSIIILSQYHYDWFDQIIYRELYKILIFVDIISWGQIRVWRPA